MLCWDRLNCDNWPCLLSHLPLISLSYLFFFFLPLLLSPFPSHISAFGLVCLTMQFCVSYVNAASHLKVLTGYFMSFAAEGAYSLNVQCTENSWGNLVNSLCALFVQACTGLFGLTDSLCSICTYMPRLFNKRCQILGMSALKMWSLQIWLWGYKIWPWM